MMRISKMRHRLDLQAPIITEDHIAGHQKSWESIGHFWCELIPNGTSENLRHEKLSAQTRLQIKTRYTDKIKPNMRFKLNERIFQIETIINEGEIKRYTISNCLEEIDKE